MSSTFHELKAAVKRLSDQIAQDERALSKIRDLLAKADARRHTPGEDARKWAKVAEDLEHSLDQTRARLERNRVLLRQTEAQFDLADSALRLRVQEACEPETGENLVHTAASISLESLIKRESDAQRSDTPDRQQRSAVELLNQLAGHQGEPTLDASRERRNQSLLRTAVDKIQRDALDHITAEERRMLIICHSLLSRRLEPSPRDKHLIKVLDKALHTLRTQRQTRVPSPPSDL